MLDGKQNRIYRPLVDAAWRVHCGRTENGDMTDQVARKHWYRQILLNEMGAVTTKDIDPKHTPMRADAFERLCLVFATAACDSEQIAYWSTAEERRALWGLERNMERAGLDWDYVKGIAMAMHLLDGSVSEIKDLPAEHIRKLSVALFLYIKRAEASRPPRPNSGRGSRRPARRAEEAVPF